MMKKPNHSTKLIPFGIQKENVKNEIVLGQGIRKLRLSKLWSKFILNQIKISDNLCNVLYFFIMPISISDVNHALVVVFQTKHASR